MTADAPKPLDPYRDAVRHHGAAFESTLWASEDSQRRRFAAFAGLLDLAGCRILDAGCGRADFGAWLLEAGIEYERYIGIEAMAPMAGFARDRELPRARIVEGDFARRPGLLATGDPEVICFSGSLNTFAEDEARRVLAAAWEKAGRALLFNFLSDVCDRPEPSDLGPARRFDTLGLLAWAAERTTGLAFRQDYFPHGHDATILMRR